MKLAAVIVLGGIIGAAGIAPVWAEDAVQKPSCVCTATYSGNGPVGSVRHVKGDVTVSQSSGYSPAKPGDPLDFGSRVMVGNGSASVAVGTCNISVPANSNLDIAQSGGNICVALAGPQASGTASLGLPAALFGGGLAVGGIIALTHDNDSSVSQ